MSGDRSDNSKRDSDELDAALAASFPASDPPSMTVPVIAGAGSADQQAAPGPVAVFRVVRRGEANEAFVAARNCDAGRWTSAGVPAVYASLSAGGALLEFLAHLEGDSPTDLTLVTGELPGEAVLVAEQIPSDWRERPYRSDVRAYGDEWAKSQRSLAFQLPSVLCEPSGNVLINPLHRDAGQLMIRAIDPITIDPRLRY